MSPSNGGGSEGEKARLKVTDRLISCHGWLLQLGLKNLVHKGKVSSGSGGGVIYKHITAEEVKMTLKTWNSMEGRNEVSGYLLIQNKNGDGQSKAG